MTNRLTVRLRPMRRSVARVAAATFATASIALASTAPAPASAAVSPDPTASTSAIGIELRALLEGVVAAGVPGATARVQDGREITVATAGVEDLATGVPLRSEARFPVGSITKTFVATVVLQLVGEGRLRLDEPVGRTLPGLLANGTSITLRQLLNHTSGLFNYTEDPALEAGVEQNRVWDPRELVAMAEAHPSSFPAGSAWAYSNTNYIVAGLLVEAVTHRRLATELRRRIFEPLDLEATSFPGRTGEVRGGTAHGYLPPELLPTPDGTPFDVTGFNLSYAWSAGAIVSNAADLSRFYRVLLGGRLLAPRLLREMKTTVPADPTNPDGYRYGLGMARIQGPCGVIWGHSGAVFGYSDDAYWNEQTGRTVVLAVTMYPIPAAAQEPYGNAFGIALCGTSAGTSHARLPVDAAA